MTARKSLWFESEVTSDKIYQAERCLIDNGIEIDEASTVLQTIGYILLDAELYEGSD